MSRSLRVMISAGYSEGHAFPAIALSRALRARGHEVLVEESEQWREVVEALGLGFVEAEEHVALGLDKTRGPTVAQVAVPLADRIREFGADVLVSDVVAPAPPIAAEIAGVRVATLLPTLYPFDSPGFPVYPLGLLPARTRLGAWMWRAVSPPLRGLLPSRRWLRRVPRLLDAPRTELGLPQLPRHGEITTYGPISRGLAIVATFPQLEHPHGWPAHVRVTGPMLFELPYPEIRLPHGEEPLVLVASSTTQDPELRLVRVALEALEGEPVRVVAATNRPGQEWSEPVPDNAVVVDWVSYAQVLPQASLVLCRGGHGTVVRALADGVPLLVCPAGADMPVNGARVAWAGAGLMLPEHLLMRGPVRWAVRRLLAEPRFAARALEIAAWGRENDGAVRAAGLVERYAPR